MIENISINKFMAGIILEEFQLRNKILIRYNEMLITKNENVFLIGKYL